VAQTPTQAALLELPSLGAERVPRRRLLSVYDLCAWAQRQTRWIVRRSGQERTSDVFVLMQAAKLTEEVGELNAQVLARLKQQRDGRTRRFSDSGLQGELADVVICAAILAHSLDIDLEAALTAKMAEVDERLSNTEAAS